MTDIVKFDPNSLQGALRERIRNLFVELVPDAAWDDLVRKEIDRFFKPKEHKNTYESLRDGRWWEPSDFEKIANAEIAAFVSAKLKATLSEIGNTTWVNNVPNPSALVSDVIRKQLDQIINAAVVQLMGSAVQQVMHAMQQGVVPR